MNTRVLVVDDAPFIREVISQTLPLYGFEVVGLAVDGQDAIEQARHLKPELILMDIVMPIKSGLEATKEIIQEFPGIKIIALSTVDQQGMILRALEAGCVDYVTKPFENTKLIQTLRRNVQR